MTQVATTTAADRCPVPPRRRARPGIALIVAAVVSAVGWFGFPALHRGDIVRPTR